MRTWKGRCTDKLNSNGLNMFSCIESERSLPASVGRDPAHRLGLLGMPGPGGRVQAGSLPGLGPLRRNGWPMGL